jgi:hypothetical protein
MMGKPEGKRPVGRPRREWEDNIEMELREIEWGGVDHWRAQLRGFRGLIRILRN